MDLKTSFSEAVNTLFFGVEILNASGDLIETFLKVPQLTHLDKVARQQNLNVAMEMESSQSWSSRHVFSFTESPWPDLIIEKGAIELTYGETLTTKKLLDINWILQFTNESEASVCYKKLTHTFEGLSTKAKFEHDKEVGEIAQFISRNPIDTGPRDITLCLGKSPLTKQFQVSLILGTEFITE